MEKCYEYYACKQTKCVAKVEHKHCWDIKKTLCHSSSIKYIRNELKSFNSEEKKCDYCAYYKEYAAIKYETVMS